MPTLYSFLIYLSELYYIFTICNRVAETRKTHSVTKLKQLFPSLKNHVYFDMSINDCEKYLVKLWIFKQKNNRQKQTLFYPLMCKGLERINFVFCLSSQDLTRISGESWKRNLRIVTIKLFVVETICLKNVLLRLINMLVNILLDVSEKAPLSGRRQSKRVTRVAYNMNNQKLQESKDEWHETQPYNWNFFAAKTKQETDI